MPTISDVLNKLIDGPLILRFPSPKLREQFRIAIYKEKRNLDEVLLMTDPEYEIQRLMFTKKEINGELTVTAKLELVDKNQNSAASKFQFEIVEESCDEPTTATAAGSG